jgi:NAD(P)-dependent dehydrogenase (short-subunit alcohol dehydrogenase family)
MTLEGETAMATGASRGIGGATAWALAGARRTRRLDRILGVRVSSKQGSAIALPT